ncbi:exocyst complex component Sec10-like protein [Zychaea mexicana]|uniref:exocyst complex component Sec10-like protein n=1 Tax=Zychaea mexicana TaxID=64656 RepID=UPI0022FDB415|nr:exocyst complex component Sec10-like protein [Zychaea mexicana]KAI9493070.1 exocyst complex component Sec10-like protein [Zychaea mexicana]
MSFIDAPDESPQSPTMPAPLTPVAAAKNPRALPPDILIRIFQYLPVPSLATVALASRRFKVLAYDDEIWDEKLRQMLDNDTGALAATLEGKSGNSALMDIGQNIQINNKPLNALIPGLSTDPYSARARAKSTGLAREKFKELYIRLLPYYVDLRQKHRESKVLSDYGTSPEECAKLLNTLVGFGACHVVEDWKQINEAVDTLCQYFESASLHEFEVAYDVHNTTDMKTYAHALIALNGGSICIQTFVQKHPIFFDNPFKPDDNYKASPNDLEPFKKLMSLVTDEFKEQSQVVSETFPEKVDVYYMFVDRVLEDVVSDYVNSLLGIAQSHETRLYLHTISVVLDSMAQVVDVLTHEDLPRRIDRERGINLIYKLFLPFLDDYLYEEQAYVKSACDKLIEEWNNDSGIRREDQSARLSNQSREAFKRNYLSAFKKVIALPVDLVSSAATTIASPFQRASSTTKTGPDEKKPNATVTVTADSPVSGSSPKSTPPSTPKVTTATIAQNENYEKQSPLSPKSPSSVSMHSRQSSRHSLRSSPDVRSVDLKFAMHELDMMQDLLSLEIVLQLIHINKDAERRVERFIQIGFPGRMRSEIQKTYEHIFVALLKTLGNQHIQPAFDRAIEHLASYTPDPESLKGSGDVPPLTEFFEMVHVGDVIQQMVQLYYDEEISKYVDKLDFINEVNKEKKIFERILDDCVANGMDRGIQVLLAQVQYILQHEQTPEDYNPAGDMIADLKPTKACQDSIACLRSNTSMLNGAAEKSTMDLFFGEVGRRFAEILYKHLKTQVVNEQGGFRYISDMNAYYDFAASLRQKTVTPYFAALKALANLYIISSAPDIKNVIHDLERYHGLMKIEDLFEFAACRSDWPIVKKVVTKDMTDCSIM